MKSEEPTNAASHGLLHSLTHKVPGVPEHKDQPKGRHQGKALQGPRPSLNHTLNNTLNHTLNGKVNGKVNGKLNGRFNNVERQRRVLPGVQDKIAHFFGRD